MRRLTLVLLLFGVSLASPALADQGGEIQVGDVARTYLIHVPDAAPPQDGYPLVLAFHGGGQQARAAVRIMQFDPLADARGFIVVYPNGLDRHWNDGRATIRNKTDDVAFVAALLDTIERTYSVNPKRVFAAGLSNGAIFSERLGCDLSGRIDAIAAVSGTMASDLAGACHPPHPVSALLISGTSDPIMPYDGGTVGQIMGAGEGGNVLSASGTADLWAHLDECTQRSEPQQLPSKDPPDGTSITRVSHDHCQSGATVTLLTVKNGGHAWPGGPQLLHKILGTASNQLDASQTIIDFFLSRPHGSLSQE